MACWREEVGHAGENGGCDVLVHVVAADGLLGGGDQVLVLRSVPTHHLHVHGAANEEEEHRVKGTACVGRIDDVVCVRRRRLR